MPLVANEWFQQVPLVMLYMTHIRTSSRCGHHPQADCLHAERVLCGFHYLLLATLCSMWCLVHNTGPYCQALRHLEPPVCLTWPRLWRNPEAKNISW